MHLDARIDKWEESYQRSENFAFFPKEEVVKFLNRFVRRRLGVDQFSDIMDFSNGMRGLDFGCGIGRQTILMKEFGIDPFGVDISSTAIDIAKELARHFGFDDIIENCLVTEGISIPFEDGFFDISIAEAVFDSMRFDIARSVMHELDRVTSKFAFLSLISGDDGTHYREYDGEETVDTQHEQGTIQSYYNWDKIHRLIEGTGFSVAWCRLITEESIVSKYISRRYYLVLQKA
jgi:SAM-dependent methyltransferase